MLLLSQTSQALSLLLVAVTLGQAQQVGNVIARRDDASSDTSLTNSLPTTSGDNTSSISPISSIPSAAPTSVSSSIPLTSGSSIPLSTGPSPTTQTNTNTQTITSQSQTAPTSTPEQSSTTSAPHSVVTTAPSQTTSVEMVTSVITENGSTFASTFASTSVGPAQSTSLADSGSSSGGGISSSTKTIIGGVVGGVGGAVVLAVLFAVIWRLRAKRRNNAVDADDVLMMGRGYSAHGEKDSTTGSSPFKSTLESYHNPSAGVNPSSNF